MTESIQNSRRSVPLVAWLRRFNRQDLALVGGKAANLGELMQAGFAVPPGFVVTTLAYDLLLHSDGLKQRLNVLLASLDASDPASLAQVCGRISQELAHISIPPMLAQEVIDA